MRIPIRDNLKDPLVRRGLRNYSPLDMRPRLVELAAALYPDKNVGTYAKARLHALISAAICQGYNGEQMIKYALFKHVRRRNLVGAFEMNVNNSRVDFLTINGHTTGYEIKSGLDNLGKLRKQANDYQKVFEYNYIVADYGHLEACLAIIPPEFGIISLCGNKKDIHRKAKINPFIDPAAQIAALTNKERAAYFSGVNSQETCLAIFNADEINGRFKKALRERYIDRWLFVTGRSEQIFPADLQFFFNQNIEPQLIYDI
ncbi:MAG: sce7726 family protein [Bacteroidetes bacterium]|nr:sce7726 family protein [Bacteroidota bacterium]